MEAWVPLFDIFLNSPSPEGEATLWLQESFDASATTTTITTNSFLSLLVKPSEAIVVDPLSTTPVSHSQKKTVMWIRTLPNAVQSRILSFLTVESGRFCSRDLASLATNILKDDEELDFWVKKAAHNLLDVLSNSSSDLRYTKTRVEEEFEALPSWLKSATDTTSPLLPWLPISHDELNVRTSVSGFAQEKQEEDVMLVDERHEEKGKERILDEGVVETDIVFQKDAPLDPDIQEKAACLKSEVLVFESASKTITLANEIRELCFHRGRSRNAFAVLGLVEPWEADDEVASILIGHLLGGTEEDLRWPSQVLCSVILPKLLVLKEPASRVLLTATVNYCKLHQKAAVDALLFPLILRMEGINASICDVVTRIIKECLHPAHVSDFCQKLLCREKEMRRFVCLPCHRSLVSDELVWTEPLFTLFQNILNHNVYLTQDSIDGLVFKVQELAQKFSKSLKFSNFLLCFITKCAPLFESHKLSLTEAVERTDTFVTKSILSKLSNY